MALGIIKQKENLYALRIIGDCGEFSTKELFCIAKICESFGKGNITATSRGTMEINGLTEEEVEQAAEAVKKAGLRLGGTGAIVRAVTACKGTVCVHGMYDVSALARKMDREFYGLPVPKKFKIGTFGCINSKGKAMNQDVGIMPSYKKRGCFELYVGGMAGHTPMHGIHMDAILTEEALFPAVHYIKDLYTENGVSPQRVRTVFDAHPELWEKLKKYLHELEENYAVH